MIDSLINRTLVFFKQNRLVILLIIYIISPIDLISEGVLGVIGLFDDFIVFIILSILVFFKYYLKNLYVKVNTKKNEKKPTKNFEYEDAEFTVIKENKTAN